MASRRRFLVSSAAMLLSSPTRVFSGETQVQGVMANAPFDQSAALQQAIEEAAAAGRALHLPPGVFRAGGLWLPRNAVLAGMPGTVLQAVGAGPILSVDGVETARLTGLTFRGISAVSDTGLLEVSDCPAFEIDHCRFASTGGRGLVLFRAGGKVSDNHFDVCRGAAIASLDATGLRIEGNRIENCDNLGLYVERQVPGPDGTIIRANRIRTIRWGEGGDGPNGNGINVFRAQGVIVADNVIDDCAFSAIRLNATRNAIVRANLCSRSQEVAIFSEFGFSGSVISDNIIDGAATGIAITNFDTGGRLATCSGNIVRNIYARSTTNPDTTPVGISAKADTILTGNLVENVPGIGLALGWGHYLKNVSATGNVLRGCEIGIGISVVAGVGTTLVADNLVAVPQGGRRYCRHGMGPRDRARSG